MWVFFFQDLHFLSVVHPVCTSCSLAPCVHVFLVIRSTTWWSSPMPSWSTCPTLPASTSPSFAPAPVTATAWTPWRTSSTRICPGSTGRRLSSISPPRGTSNGELANFYRHPGASRHAHGHWGRGTLYSRGWIRRYGKALQPFGAFSGFCALILQSTPPWGYRGRGGNGKKKHGTA